MRPSRCPLRELATSGLETSTSGGIEKALLGSRGLPGPPWPFQGNRQAGAVAVGGIQLVCATSDPRFTSGRRLLLDTAPRSDPSLHSRSMPSPSGVACTPLMRPWSGPPSWPQTRLWGLMVGSDGLHSRVAGVEKVVGDAERDVAGVGILLASHISDPPGVR